VDRLGHIFPELFPYWFVDHWTDDIARLIGRLSFADVAHGSIPRRQDPGNARARLVEATFFDAAYLMRPQDRARHHRRRGLSGAGMAQGNPAQPLAAD